MEHAPELHRVNATGQGSARWLSVRRRRRGFTLVTKVGPKVVMAIGMTLIGAGILWATHTPVHGHFLGNLVGPFAVAGAGTAFSFIPISVAALAGVAEHRAGLASGLLNTSTQLGGAIGIAIASSVAAAHAHTFLRAGDTAPAALTGGFRQAFWVLRLIALLALPAIFVLLRREQRPSFARDTAVANTQPALAGASRIQGERISIACRLSSA